MTWVTSVMMAWWRTGWGGEDGRCTQKGGGEDRGQHYS